MVKAVIFDCFGVLVTESWKAFRLEHFGHDQALLERVAKISDRADSGLITHQEEIRATAELAGLTPDEVLRQLNRNAPNEPLLEYIGGLKKRYKIGMLSNASVNSLNRLFTPAQLALFDAVNLSFELGYAKPNPRAYANMAESLGVAPEECVLVDDTERHCVGGSECGLKTILYKDFGQARAELEELLADPKG